MSNDQLATYLAWSAAIGGVLLLVAAVKTRRLGVGLFALALAGRQLAEWRLSGDDLRTALIFALALMAVGVTRLAVEVKG
jgi:hypothetical protein